VDAAQWKVTGKHPDEQGNATDAAHRDGVRQVHDRLVWLKKGPSEHYAPAALEPQA
jgi:hypothetical protein